MKNDKIKKRSSSSHSNQIELRINEETIGKVRHDLKNPLTVIKMHVELLAMDSELLQKTPKLKKALKIIDEQIEKINSFLDHH